VLVTEKLSEEDGSEAKLLYGGYRQIMIKNETAENGLTYNFSKCSREFWVIGC
jgi:hypothetical protein